ncbi:MAG: radical SAM protein [Candidatus Thorarchaeota archaeon]
MRVASVIDISLVDVPRIPVTVLFTAGCNMDCSFCQNAEIIPRNSGQEMELPDIVTKLTGNLTDGYCITGGEPTIQRDLPELLNLIREQEVSKHINLNTQGTRPEVLEQCLPFLDSVWFDIKTTPQRYAEVCRVRLNPWPKVKTSIDLLVDSDIKFWPRTTYVGGLISYHELLDIAEILLDFGYRGDYLIQNFKKSSGTRAHDVSTYYEPEISEIEQIVDQIPQGINLKLEWR